MAETNGRRPNSALRVFLRSEAGGGVLLMAAAAAALVVANSPLAPAYQSLIQGELGAMSVQHWINDALMALFFMLVGLEIKREFVDGRLATWERRRLPIVAAAAGMAVPALIYLGVAGGEPGLARGWAIPAATDIAFAIGVLALLGKRAPTSLKLFLVTVAIADDLGAVAIIAIAYTASLDWIALAAAGLILLALCGLGRFGVRSLAVFLTGAALLWVAVLQSGVHPTVAGVLAAAAVPLTKTPGAPDDAHSPLHRLEHGLAPWVAYLILPLFGFANAGVALAGVGALLAPLPLAIAAGLFLGKQIGIFGGVAAAVRLGLAAPLRGATWLQLWGVAMLGGIGFTMSLFIGALAFPNDPALVEEAKLGVLAGSFLSALAGYVLLRLAPPHLRHQEEEARLDREIAADGDADGLEESEVISLRLLLLPLLLLAGCVSAGPARESLDAIASDYVKLQLAIGEKEEGYIDAYYGPPDWQAEAKMKASTLPELAARAAVLAVRLRSLADARLEPIERRRRDFLLAQLRSASTRLRMMQGEKLAFADEAEGLFEVRPELKPLADYDPVLARLERLVPGTGPLADRVDAFQDRFIVPRDRLDPVMRAAIAECRRRTMAHVGLPANERFTLEFVTGKSWGGYNWYKGDSNSLIQVNTDLPVRIGRAVDLGCHEGYPGHHVHNVLLEQTLAKGRGWVEFSVYPLYSPQSFIAEGSANYGIELAFPKGEQLAFETAALYPRAGLPTAGAAQYLALQDSIRDLAGARFTIAADYLDGRITRAKAVELTRKYQLVSPVRAEKSVAFIDQYRSYVINYGLGLDYVRTYVESFGESPQRRWAAMESLLSGPTLPSDLVVP